MWLHFSKVYADNTHYSICDAKGKARQGNTSNMKKYLVKLKIYLKADECAVFDSLKKAKSPTASTANVSKPLASAEDVVPSMDSETLSEESSATSSPSSGTQL